MLLSQIGPDFYSFADPPVSVSFVLLLIWLFTKYQRFWKQRGLAVAADVATQAEVDIRGNEKWQNTGARVTYLGLMPRKHKAGPLSSHCTFC